MTLCVGWIDTAAVYLTADSAVTRPPKDLNNEYSTFGEKQPQTATLTVEEAALKIYRHKDSAAAFAGNASLIEDIFSNYVNASRLWSLRDAFSRAWTSSSSGGELEALFAYHDGDAPRLIKYDSASLDGIEVTSACIGSIAVEDKDYINSVLQSMPRNADAASRLVCGVCISQRLAILANIMETHGIGGVVAGCSVSTAGFRWSPDTMHVILRGNATDQRSDELLSSIITCARLDVLFVRNNLSPGYNCFANGFGANLGLTPKEVVEKIFANQEALPPLNTELKVEYVVFHDVINQLSTIFDVRSGGHPNLKYWLGRDDTGRLSLHFRASDNGFGALRRPSTPGGDIAFVPHNYS